MGLSAALTLPMALIAANASVTAPGSGAEPGEDAPQLIEPAPITAHAAEPFSDIQMQVERRVIIRITPLSRMAPQPKVSVPVVEEQRRRPDGTTHRCIPIKDIAGVRLGAGRNLMLYMRDRRVIGTQLDRSCQISSFYSGFYVERPEDGMLCAGREALHARSGADCEMGTFVEIQPSDDD